jgi:hypothetical protein
LIGPKISAGIPGVSSRDVDGLNIEGKNDILQLLEILLGIRVESQGWGGETPAVRTGSRKGENRFPLHFAYFSEGVLTLTYLVSDRPNE